MRNLSKGTLCNCKSSLILILLINWYWSRQKRDRSWTHFPRCTLSDPPFAYHITPGLLHFAYYHLVSVVDCYDVCCPLAFLFLKQWTLSHCHDDFRLLHLFKFSNANSMFYFIITFFTSLSYYLFIPHHHLIKYFTHFCPIL